VSSKLKTFSILGALAFAVGVGAFLFLWRLAGGANVAVKAEINNCQWQSAAGKLKWQCQIKNSGFKRWSGLKFQIAVWSADNIWQNLNGVTLDNLGWGGQQDVSGQADLTEGVWRVRASVLDGEGEVLAQSDKFWAQTAGDKIVPAGEGVGAVSQAGADSATQTWLKNFLKNRADWMDDNTTPAAVVRPSTGGARGCNARGCWQSCLAGLDLAMPATCADNDLACQKNLNSWAVNARLCDLTCQKSACGFCLADTCGQAPPTGQTFCQERDLYHRYQKYQCQATGGATIAPESASPTAPYTAPVKAGEIGVCALVDIEEKIQSCGQAEYGEWGAPYCRGNLLLRQRTVQEPYCLAGRCLKGPALDEELVRTCEEGCVDTQCLGNQSPTAEASADQFLTVAQAKAPVYFTGTGSDSDGQIVLYEWDFNGDGRTDFSAPDTGSAQYIYGRAGTYTARLRVTDDSGNQTVAETKVSFSGGEVVATADDKPAEMGAARNFVQQDLWKIIIVVIGAGALIYFISRV